MPLAAPAARTRPSSTTGEWSACSYLETTLDSAQQLIAHGANELVQGRYIQTPQEMLVDASRFDAINRVMHDLLDRLATDRPDRIAPAGGESR